MAIYLGGVATFCKLCRLEAAFEPIFAELALYDLKERKKVCINTSYVRIIIVCYVRMMCVGESHAYFC